MNTDRITTNLKKLKKLKTTDKVYFGTVIPLWLSFTIYILIGVPIL
jgi:hypothetical protein